MSRLQPRQANILANAGVKDYEQDVYQGIDKENGTKLLELGIGKRNEQKFLDAISKLEKQIEMLKASNDEAVVIKEKEMNDLKTHFEKEIMELTSKHEQDMADINAQAQAMVDEKEKAIEEISIELSKKEQALQEMNDVKDDLINQMNERDEENSMKMTELEKKYEDLFADAIGSRDNSLNQAEELKKELQSMSNQMAQMEEESKQERQSNAKMENELKVMTQQFEVMHEQLKELQNINEQEQELSKREIDALQQKYEADLMQLQQGWEKQKYELEEKIRKFSAYEKAHGELRNENQKLLALIAEEKRKNEESTKLVERIARERDEFRDEARRLNALDRASNELRIENQNLRRTVDDETRKRQDAEYRVKTTAQDIEQLRLEIQRLSALDKNYRDTRMENQQLQQILDEERRKLQNGELQVRRISQERDALKDEVQRFELAEKQFEQTRTDQVNKLKVLEEDLKRKQDLESQIRKISQENDELRLKVSSSALQSNHGQSQLKGEISSLKFSLDEERKRREELEHDIRFVTQERDKLKHEIIKLRSSDNFDADLRSDARALKRAYEEEVRKRRDIESSYETLKQKWASTSDVIKTLKLALAESKPKSAKYDGVDSEYSEFDALDEQSGIVKQKHFEDHDEASVFRKYFAKIAAQVITLQGVSEGETDSISKLYKRLKEIFLELVQLRRERYVLQEQIRLGISRSLLEAKTQRKPSSSSSSITASVAIGKSSE